MVRVNEIIFLSVAQIDAAQVRHQNLGHIDCAVIADFCRKHQTILLATAGHLCGNVIFSEGIIAQNQRVRGFCHVRNMPRQFDPFAVLQAIEFNQRVARRAADIVGIGRKIPQFCEISDLTVETSPDFIGSQFHSSIPYQ